MAGFYDVDGGRITLGGTDTRPIDSVSMMKDFSVVFQNVVLFNNTVMENIRVGRKDAPVILLDEATAFLDVDNETEIQDAISRLVRGKTPAKVYQILNKTGIMAQRKRHRIQTFSIPKSISPRIWLRMSQSYLRKEQTCSVIEPQSHFLISAPRR